MSERARNQPIAAESRAPSATSAIINVPTSDPVLDDCFAATSLRARSDATTSSIALPMATYGVISP